MSTVSLFKPGSRQSLRVAVGWDKNLKPLNVQVSTIRLFFFFFLQFVGKARSFFTLNFPQPGFLPSLDIFDVLCKLLVVSRGIVRFRLEILAKKKKRLPVAYFPF